MTDEEKTSMLPNVACDDVQLVTEADMAATLGVTAMSLNHDSYRQTGGQCPVSTEEGSAGPSSGEAGRAPGSETGASSETAAGTGFSRGDTWGLTGFADDPFWNYQEQLAAHRIALDVAGSEMSNTDPAKRQNCKGESGEEVERGGIDTLHITVYGTHEEWWERVEEQLREAKSRAAENREEAFTVRLGDDIFRVMPDGTGKAWNAFAYVLKIQGMTFKLSGKETGDKSDLRACAAIEIPSEVFLMWGDYTAVKMAYAYLRALGISPVDDIPSRVDLCVDLPGRSMQEVKALIDGKQVVTRTRKLFEIKGGKGFSKLQTVYFGSNSAPIRLRIYDKALEAKKGSLKRGLLQAFRWNGEVKTAVRVEFQLRRDALRDQGINTIQQLFDSLGTLTAYLTEEWFRFADQAVDDHRNYSRAGVASFWDEVQEFFASWTFGRWDKPRATRRAVVDPERHWKQAIGHAGRAAAEESYFNGTQAEIEERMTREVSLLMSDPVEFTKYFGEKVLTSMEAFLERGNRRGGMVESIRAAVADLRMYRPGFMAKTAGLTG